MVVHVFLSSTSPCSARNNGIAHPSCNSILAFTGCFSPKERHANIMLRLNIVGENSVRTHPMAGRPNQNQGSQGEGGSRIFPDRYYPLLGLMPVSFATVLGENRTNLRLATNSDRPRNSPFAFSRSAPISSGESCNCANQVIDYNALLKRGFMADVRGSLGNVSLRRKVFATATFVIMLSMPVYSEQKNSADTTGSVQSFLERWDLTLKTPLR